MRKIDAITATAAVRSSAAIVRSVDGPGSGRSQPAAQSTAEAVQRGSGRASAIEHRQIVDVGPGQKMAELLLLDDRAPGKHQHASKSGQRHPAERQNGASRLGGAAAGSAPYDSWAADAESEDMSGA